MTGLFAVALMNINGVSIIIVRCTCTSYGEHVGLRHAVLRCKCDIAIVFLIKRISSGSDLIQKHIVHFQLTFGLRTVGPFSHKMPNIAYVVSSIEHV